MIQCSRFYTDQNFKKRVIINSCSLRNIKWGVKNNDLGRKSLVESTTTQNIFDNSFKRKKPSNSTEKEKKEKILNKEEEQKRKEELSRKREMSYRARKRIILRMRGIQDEKEQKKEIEKEKNKKQKIRKIEIKFQIDNIKFKRVNSNDIINCNNNKNKFDLLDKINNNINNNKKRNSEIINDNKNSINKKNNFVFYRNIRNIYKKNLIKDISVLTDKSCKILKVKKIFHEKKKEEFDKNNDLYNKNNIKKNNGIHRENNEETKNKNNENNSKNKYFINYLNSLQNKNSIYNDLNCKNKSDINDIYYSLNTSGKNITRINSDFLENKKQNTYFDFEEKDFKLNDEKINETNFNDIVDININKKKFRRKRNDNSEKRYLYNFSFFNYFPSKTNNKENEDEGKYSSKTKSKTYKIDTHSHKSLKKERKNNNLNMINLKILSNKSIQNNKFNCLDSDYFDDNENKKLNYFDRIFYEIYFFEDLIDISNAIDDRDLLDTLLNNFNHKYFLINDNINKKYFNYFKEKENFEYIFKHFDLVLICLIFFAKDELLYNSYLKKVRDLLIQLIYSSLNYVEIDGNKESNKIYNFINNNNFQTVIPNHRYILSLIYLLFDNKKEYIPLKEALEQIHSIIMKKDYQFIIKIINDSILFCYNSKPKCVFNFPFFAFKSNLLTIKNNQDKQNNDINYTNYNSNRNNVNKFNNNNKSTNNIPHNNISNISIKLNFHNKNLDDENFPRAPFIKTPMKKKFCLVLDIDETISHSLKLSFGCYFLLRPGARNFLEEVSKFYEIIIFTSSPKKYADKILNKIDIDGNLISHRLYRTHVLYENGKSVKNLNLIGRDLTKTIFIDNLRSNAKYNLNNLCPITSWRSDIFDNRLIKLKDKLLYIATSGKFDDDITQGL